MFLSLFVKNEEYVCMGRGTYSQAHNALKWLLLAASCHLISVDIILYIGSLFDLLFWTR